MYEIEVKHLSKTYTQKDATVEALKDLCLNIEAGEIYGIIGMSGAGKSTLVRCLNFLEKPSEGEVLIRGKSLGALSEKELRSERREISMIFQHFNLLMQKNVLDNICFPLRLAGVPKKEAREKARNLLKTVGMAEKEKAYPAQLSGGQQQRVAIARALASNPKILLCDEATSALDPQTTSQILDLLKTINREMGITIVIITHQMSVIQEICNKVAIIEHGVLVENGPVADVFAHPQSKAAFELLVGNKADNSTIDELHSNNVVRITFSENSAFEPVISNLILKFNTPVNILGADTKNVGGVAKGEMLLALPENPAIRGEMIDYMKERGLEVREVSYYVG